MSLMKGDIFLSELANGLEGTPLFRVMHKCLNTMTWSSFGNSKKGKSKCSCSERSLVPCLWREEDKDESGQETSRKYGGEGANRLSKLPSRAGV